MTLAQISGTKDHSYSTVEHLITHYLGPNTEQFIGPVVRVWPVKHDWSLGPWASWNAENIPPKNKNPKLSIVHCSSPLAQVVFKVWYFSQHVKSGPMDQTLKPPYIILSRIQTIISKQAKHLDANSYHSFQNEASRGKYMAHCRNLNSICNRSRNRRAHKGITLCAMEYYSVLGKDRILIFATWLELEREHSW